MVGVLLVTPNNTTVLESGEVEVFAIVTLIVDPLSDNCGLTQMKLVLVALLCDAFKNDKILAHAQQLKAHVPQLEIVEFFSGEECCENFFLR